jgi:hypothetical protein
VKQPGHLLDHRCYFGPSNDAHASADLDRFQAGTATYSLISDEFATANAMPTRLG